jgi:hypothetical protein
MAHISIEIIDSEKNFFEDIYELVKVSGAFENIAYFGVGGSIGRREKTIFEKNLNDIDFMLIGDVIDPVKKSKLEAELCRISNTKYTDITVINKRAFSKKEIDQYVFDFIFGNIAIYASSDCNRLLAKLKYSEPKVSRRSIVTLFVTRSYGYELNYSAMSDSFYRRYQMKKVILAYIDSILIKEGVYISASTEEKLNMISGKIPNYNHINCMVNNFEFVDFYELRATMIDSYVKLNKIVLTTCLFDVLKICSKPIFAPNKERISYAKKLMKLLWNTK